MEIEVSGNNYRIGKMDVFTQLHVSRKISPAFVEAKAGGRPEILVIAEALAAMSMEDVNFVVSSCLSVCTRQEGTGWQRVQSSPGVLQYQDIQLDTMIKLCVETIKDNLANFFDGL